MSSQARSDPEEEEVGGIPGEKAVFQLPCTPVRGGPSKHTRTHAYAQEHIYAGMGLGVSS